MTTEEMIAVMQAHADGQPIEARVIGTNSWFIVGGVPLWNWAQQEYRVAESPIPSSPSMSWNDCVIGMRDPVPSLSIRIQMLFNMILHLHDRDRLFTEKSIEALTKRVQRLEDN